MKTKVNDILKRKGTEVWTISPDTLVYRALLLMQEKGVGAAVVCGAHGEVEGIMTERDYARKVILEGKSSKETLTADIMTKELYVVPPTATVDECISLMTEKRIRHLPVLDKGKLIGLVSIGDVVKAIVREQKIEIEHLNKYIMGSYV